MTTTKRIILRVLKSGFFLPCSTVVLNLRKGLARVRARGADVVQLLLHHPGELDLHEQPKQQPVQPADNHGPQQWTCEQCVFFGTKK